MSSNETDIRETLEALPSLPADVSEWKVRTGTDSADEPAVWIWAVLRDKDTDFDALIEIRDIVLGHLRETISTPESPLGIYVSFTSADDVVLAQSA